MTQERRLSPRFHLQGPVTLLLQNGLKVECKTRDISASGVFFYANVALQPHDEVELMLTLPYNLRPGPIWVTCRAKVLRLEQCGTGEASGVAVGIQAFDFWTESEMLEKAIV